MALTSIFSPALGSGTFFQKWAPLLTGSGLGGSGKLAHGSPPSAQSPVPWRLLSVDAHWLFVSLPQPLPHQGGIQNGRSGDLKEMAGEGPVHKRLLMFRLAAADQSSLLGTRGQWFHSFQGHCSSFSLAHGSYASATSLLLILQGLHLERSPGLRWVQMLLGSGELTSIPERTGTLSCESPEGKCRPLPAVGKPIPSPSLIFSCVESGVKGRGRGSESSPTPPPSDNLTIAPTLPSTRLRRRMSQIHPECPMDASFLSCELDCGLTGILQTPPPWL